MNTRVKWEGLDPATQRWVHIQDGNSCNIPDGYEQVRLVITYGEPVESPLCRSKFDWNGLTFQRKEKVS